MSLVIVSGSTKTFLVSSCDVFHHFINVTSSHRVVDLRSKSLEVLFF